MLTDEEERAITKIKTTVLKVPKRTKHDFTAYVEHWGMAGFCQKCEKPSFWFYAGMWCPTCAKGLGD